MSGASTTKRLAGRLVRWALRLAVLAFALLVTAAIVVVVVIPRMTQGAAMTVLTGSMTPEIPVGSIVVVRPVDPRTLEVGDVATYQVEPKKEVFITHRIVKIRDTSDGLTFVFKGDANRGADVDPVPSGAIRGEVWFHVPYLGAIRDGLHGKGGITLVIMILLAGYAVTQLSGGLRDRRKPKPGEPTGAGLTIHKTLLLAEFPRGDDVPEDRARQWGALLVDSAETTYTLLIAPPADGVAAAVELVQSQEPNRLQVWDAPTTVTGTPRAIEQLPTTEQKQVEHEAHD